MRNGKLISNIYFTDYKLPLPVKMKRYVAFNGVVKASTSEKGWCFAKYNQFGISLHSFFISKNGHHHSTAPTENLQGDQGIPALRYK